MTSHDINDDEDSSNKNSEILDLMEKALENFTPYLTQKLNETLEGAMSDHIAAKIKEEVANAVQAEFEKRFPQDKEKEAEVEKELRTGVLTIKDKMDIIKSFAMVKPSEYDGNPDPIISTRWVSEIEGSFRSSLCPLEFRTLLGSSMLRGPAKAWWDAKILIDGEEKVMEMNWDKFKECFFQEFRSESEVTRLRREFLNTSQGNMTVNEFKVKFLNGAQFCPEYLKSDLLLKEHFYGKLRKSIRERISLRQIDKFSTLVDVARDHDIEQTITEDESYKRSTISLLIPLPRSLRV